MRESASSFCLVHINSLKEGSAFLTGICCAILGDAVVKVHIFKMHLYVCTRRHVKPPIIQKVIKH